MEHFASIVWLISLPVLIWVAYKASQYALHIFDKNREKEENDSR
ncbi:MAG: hypothetical protein R6U19_09290 [Bacteroidales bacterium]